MKLKKVEIIGFKSFAEKTVIEFHEGITCIVGPNGCGKSNIGDAIRWVLGEQSAKAMRGGKMPDVIFAGASSKKALNFAEVTISFTEINGALPLDYDEIAITRKLHRSGESEYFINRQLVRLKDVHSLFLDSGIGKNNISFFEQGKIDQLIQYSPEERRSIFEEAAGIVRFLQRKRESFRKLDDVTSNLDRVADILGEVEKQVLSLEEQAAKAEEYKEKKESLERYEKGHLISRYLTFVKKKEDLNVKEGEAQASLVQFVEKKEQNLAILSEKKQTHDHLSKGYAKAREEFLSYQKEKELKVQLESHSQERMDEINQKKKKITQELSSLQLDKIKWETESACLKEKKENLHLELKNAEVIKNQVKIDLQEHEKRQEALKKKETESYREKVSAFQRQAALQSEVKQLLVRVETNLEKKEQFDVRSKNLLAVIQEKDSEVKLKKEAQLKEEGLAKLALEHGALLESKLKLAIEQVQINQLTLDEHVVIFQEKSAKLKALLALRQEFSGFSDGGKKLLQESQNKQSPVFGLLKGLYEAVIPKPGNELAVSAALKRYCQTLVVATENDLKLTLDHAKKLGLSDFSIICLDALEKKENHSSFLDESSNHVLASHLFESFGYEEDCLVAMRIATLNKKSFWINSSIYIDSNGVLFIGGKKESSVFLRESEIKSLEKELQELIAVKQKKEITLELSLKARMDLQAEKSKADMDLRRLEMKGVEANFIYQKALSDFERVCKEKKQVDSEIEGLGNLIKDLVKNQEKIQEDFKGAASNVDKIQETLQSVELESKICTDEANLKKQAYLKAENEVQKLDQEYRKIAYQYNVLDTKSAEGARLFTRLSHELEAIQTSEKEWKNRKTDALMSLSEISKLLVAAKLESDQLQEHQLQAKVIIQTLENELKDVEKSVKDVENKLHQVGIQLAHVETGQNAVSCEMQERFDENIEVISHEFIPLNIAQDKLEKQIQQLRQFIQENQNVNLAAISECKLQKERAEFLKSQVADLNGAKLELLKMIEDLDAESRLLFKTTFEEIRRNFQKNFQILFKGGEADLELLESKDILDAGIEITAKPPGKQMRSLSLLSGGEKCLTAMALLFAIFEVKSAPFCILDEIDAPLDDSNVERFLNVVKQFVDRCQFIIVTHNKRTMALADRLYGVSMEEKGISKLLFMEFSGKSTTQLVGV